jgi:hypothetical protein
MKSAELVRALSTLSKQGKWLIKRSDFSVLFPDETNENLKKSLNRHIRNGYIERVAHGLYRNTLAEVSSRPLEQIAGYLRPLDFNYLTGETVLSELSVISQMTQNYLTVMTTGCSKKTVTPFGTIEFTHTKRQKDQVMKDLAWDSDREMYVANIDRAYGDLLRIGRNVDMVDMDELKEQRGAKEILDTQTEAEAELAE